MTLVAGDIAMIMARLRYRAALCEVVAAVSTLTILLAGAFWISLGLFGR